MMVTETLAALTARLQRLEDLEAIRQLFIDYGAHLDRGDFVAYAALFADEGEVLLGPIGRARGPAAIRALLEANLAGQRGMSYHLIANPQVQLDGDHATSVVAWAVIAPRNAANPALTMLGHHRDVLIRERGQWKFLCRAGYLDLPKSSVTA